MSQVLLQPALQDSHYFDPEGLPNRAITYFYKEMEDMYLALRKHDFSKTSCEGYLSWRTIGKELKKTDRMLAFEKKQDKDFSVNLNLTNADDTYTVHLVLETLIPYKNYLNSYCRVDGYVISDERRKKYLFVTDIIQSEPTYDFDSDPQYSNLQVKNLDDAMTLFPSQDITNHEDKQKSILLTLVGAQEKQLTKGGVGSMLLLPSDVKATDVTNRYVDNLSQSIANCWFPSITRDNLSPNLPSFLSGTYQHVWSRVSNNPGNFLSQKINRELVHKVPNVKAEPRILDILKYSHAPIYLDERLAWLGDFNSVRMLLIRARASRVHLSGSIYDEAQTKEKELKSRFLDEFRIPMQIPTPITDLAECLAKINGHSDVSLKDVHEASKIVFELNSEAVVEIGAQAELIKESVLGMDSESRIVYNLISDLGESLPLGELRELAIGKGIKENKFERIINGLRQSGEIFEDRKDGKVYMKKV